MFEFLISLLVTWPIQAIVALLFAGPAVVLTRKKTIWRWRDLLAFLAPWLLWFVVFAFGPRSASLPSAILESSMLGLFVGFSFVVFAILQTRAKSPPGRLWFLSSACIFAVIVWALFPFLGE